MKDWISRLKRASVGGEVNCVRANEDECGCCWSCCMLARIRSGEFEIAESSRLSVGTLSHSRAALPWPTGPIAPPLRHSHYKLWISNKKLDSPSQINRSYIHSLSHIHTNIQGGTLYQTEAPSFSHGLKLPLTHKLNKYTCIYTLCILVWG